MIRYCKHCQKNVEVARDRFSRAEIFDYYQFWRNSDDSDVKRLLFFFTPLPTEEIEELGSLPSPEINRAKEILAYEATALAHGPEEAEKAYLAAGSKFGFADADGKIKTSSSISKVNTASGAGMDELPTYAIPSSELSGNGIWIIKLLTDSGLCASNGEARRLIQGGGAYIDDCRITEMNTNINAEHLEKGFAILKAGKKNLKRLVSA